MDQNKRPEQRPIQHHDISIQPLNDFDVMPTGFYGKWLETRRIMVEPPVPQEIIEKRHKAPKSVLAEFTSGLNAGEIQFKWLS